MRFGLERIQRLVTALGMPQHRFASVHVVGTNGKSSVTEMTAALLEAHGLARRRLPLAARRALARADPDRRRRDRRRRRSAPRSSASPRRSRRSSGTLDPGESVTQFEADTAAAFVALAAARVDVGGDRGRARRPPRRDQRAPLEGHRADLDRARAHRVARRHRGRDRRREARRAARPHDPGARAGLARRSRSWRARTAAERSAASWSPSATSAPAVDAGDRGALPAPQLRRRAGGRRGDRSARSTPSASAGVAAELELPRADGGDRRRPAAGPRRRPQPGRRRGARRGAAGGRRRAPGDRLPGGARRQGRRRRSSARWRRRSPAWSRPRSPPTCSPQRGGPARRALEAARAGRGRARRRARHGWRRRPTRRRRSPGRASSPDAQGGVAAGHRLALPARATPAEPRPSRRPTRAAQALAELAHVALEPVRVVVGPALEILEVAIVVGHRMADHLAGRDPVAAPAASGPGAAPRRPGAGARGSAGRPSARRWPVAWTISIPIATWLRPTVCRQRIRGGTSSSMVPSCSIT